VSGTKNGGFVTREGEKSMARKYDLTKYGRNGTPAGVSRKCEPIRSEEAIQKIKGLLADNPRDLLIFTLGINTGLRQYDLMELRVRPLLNATVGDKVYVKEHKTGKMNFFKVNKEIYKCLWLYFRSPFGLTLQPDDYLFKSIERPGHHIHNSFVATKIKNWAKEVGLSGKYSSHTLRKTWGYMQRTKYKAQWELLSERFRHDDLAVTRAYLGITDDEIGELLMRNI
jgi:integrase